METALERLQTGLENVARVIDVHGECATSDGSAPEEPIYDLEIAREALQDAERLLESDATDAWSLTDYAISNLQTFGARIEDSDLGTMNHSSAMATLLAGDAIACAIREAAVRIVAAIDDHAAHTGGV